MGLFNFIKEAGKKLGIGGGDDAPDVEAVKKELASHDLGTDKVQVEVVDDKVVLKGEVADQSVFEKAVIAVGNTLGISKVEAGELKVAEAPAKEPVFTRSRRAITSGRSQRPSTARQMARRTISSSKPTSRC